MKPEWQRSLVTLTATVVIVTVVALLYWAKAVFIPLALAIFLAFVLAPVVARLQRRGFGRTTAVIVTVSLVIIVSSGVAALVTQQLTQLTADLPDRAEAIKEKVARAKSMLGGDGSSRFSQLVDDVTQVIVPKRVVHQTVVVEPASPSLWSQYLTYVGPAGEVLGQVAFTFILTVFMLLKREDLRNRIIRLLGDGKVTTTTRAVDDATTRISRYLLMQFILNTTFGIIITVGLLLLGVNYAILWGLIATVMRYVPYIGTWFGLIPPVLFSFATAPNWGGGWGQPLAVLALFIGLELLCNNIVEPKLYGSSMGLSEVALLVAAAFWALLWGPIGLVLSGPLTVCLLVLGRHVRRFEYLEVILGDQPALAPQVAFYQRLAARDQDEAAALALKTASDADPDAAIETVVLPALCIARRDLDDGDLNAEDYRFVVASSREIVAEVNEERESPAVNVTENRVKVLIVPARDEAEHVAADALAAALDPTRWEARVTGDEMLASELSIEVEKYEPDVVVILALPPGGLSHCRYLVSRLRAKAVNVPLLVGRWDYETQEDKPVETETGIKGADGVDRTMSDTRKRLAELRSLAVAKPTEPRPIVATVNLPVRHESDGLAREVLHTHRG